MFSKKSMSLDGLFSHIKNDFSASVVVFLVATPLCLGVALASGAPLFSGLIAGMIGGIVVGMLSNSHLSVSGPAAGLIAIVLVAIQDLGSFELFLAAVVISGLLQVALGIIKAGSIANYFPSSVIKGMLSAIGIIIILKQIPHALGFDEEAEGEEDFNSVEGGTTFSRVMDSISEYINPAALIIALISLVILVLFDPPAVKNKIKSIPGALVAVIVAIGLNQLFLSQGGDFGLSGNHLVNIPVASTISEFFGQFTTPDFSALGDKRIYVVALTLAAVASVESLLCIEAVDKLDPMRRQTSYNRELVAQGLGNITSGLIGGLPITSVIVRSSANLDAGAKTKLSTILHGVLILVSVALIPSILNMVPKAALAAVLLLVGYKLAKPSFFMTMYKKGIFQFAPFIITVVAVVFTDLLTGVGIGLMASVFSILFGNLKNSYFFHKEKYKEGDIITIELSQEVSFLNKASIKQTLQHLPDGAHVIIDASKSFYIDYDVAELIREFRDVQAPYRNIKVVFKGFKESYKIDNQHLVHLEKDDSELSQKLKEKVK